MGATEVFEMAADTPPATKSFAKATGSASDGTMAEFWLDILSQQLSYITKFPDERTNFFRRISLAKQCVHLTPISTDCRSVQIFTIRMIFIWHRVNTQE